MHLCIGAGRRPHRPVVLHQGTPVAERDHRVGIEDGRAPANQRQVVVLAHDLARGPLHIDDPLLTRMLTMHPHAIRREDLLFGWEPHPLDTQDPAGPRRRLDAAQRAAPGARLRHPELQAGRQQVRRHRAVLRHVDPPAAVNVDRDVGAMDAQVEMMLLEDHVARPQALDRPCVAQPAPDPGNAELRRVDPQEVARDRLRCPPTRSRTKSPDLLGRAVIPSRNHLVASGVEWFHLCTSISSSRMRAARGE